MKRFNSNWGFCSWSLLFNLELSTNCWLAVSQKNTWNMDIYIYIWIHMEHQWNMDHKKQVVSGGCHPSSFPFPSLPGQCDGHLGGHWSEARLGPSKRDVWKMDGCVIFPSYVLYNYIISWDITHDHPIIIYYYGWLVVTGTMEFEWFPIQLGLE
jgi:hypothetical protein